MTTSHLDEAVCGFGPQRETSKVVADVTTRFDVGMSCDDTLQIEITSIDVLRAGIAVDW